MGQQYTRPTGFTLKPLAPRQRLTVDDTAGGVSLTVPAGALAGSATLAPSEARLLTTFPAPPGILDSPVTRTIGTGASGEMRETFPQM